MAKISQYPNGTTPQNTDKFIVARGAANYYLTWLELYNALPVAPTTTALSDFQVGDGAGAWIKKTLAETKTILGIVAVPATTALSDFQVGDGAGAWIKKTLAEVKTILGLGVLAYLGTINNSALLDNNIVPYSKIQQVSATNKLLGRSTAGAGNIEEIGLASDHEFSGGNLRMPAFTGDVTKAAGALATTVVAASLTVAGKVELATTAEINSGVDTTRAMPVDQFVASNRNVRFFLIRVVDSATNCGAGTTKGGDIELPFTGTITEIGAYVDTAGTTGTMTVDVNLNGATIMTTNKITIDSTEKSSRTAATPPALTTTAVTAGDLLTIDIDAIHTTPAKGLTVRVGIRQT